MKGCVAELRWEGKKRFNLTKEEKTSRENVIWHRSHRCRDMKMRKACLDCMQWNRFLIKYTMEIL